ncbi:MAG TPA: rhodanese-like domain-containing protein [Bacteroidales bacterium]|nr:rhodanese-like domain-containing protein [Bacteroidales bacterium]
MKEFFCNSGFEIAGILNLTGKQALQCIDNGALLVDVREEYEIAIKDFNAPGKIFCPFSEFDSLAKTLPADRSLIVADCTGIHSKEAVRKLLDAGFPKVANLAGGIAEWERDGLPMKQSAESMTGQCPCTMRSRTT